MKETFESAATVDAAAVGAAAHEIVASLDHRLLHNFKPIKTNTETKNLQLFGQKKMDISESTVPVMLDFPYSRLSFPYSSANYFSSYSYALANSKHCSVCIRIVSYLNLFA